MTTKVLVRAAFFAALSIILTRFLSIMVTENIRIGFGPIPIMLTGLFYGPIVGGIVGFVADIVGVLINPMGSAIHPGFTFSSILTGALPGIVYMLFLRKKGKDGNFKLAVVISVLLVAIIINLLLNTLWLSGLYGNPYMIVLIPRLPKIIIQGIVEIVVMMFLYKPLVRI
ncbi:folate family ECF transporter S component [Anaerosphaera multitolerans]|uniref:Folate family ECF transporter S component n=2 Tax=Anaerosphaera multitolerans TaxID=2487351 RepID=A0A437S5W5_9FIRM|nr:folate family ECF transporter S component [Anaerosphaera multitolerans]